MVRANRCKIIFARRSPMYRSSRRRVYVLRLTFTSPPTTTKGEQEQRGTKKNKEEEEEKFVLFVSRSQHRRIDLHAWLIRRKKRGGRGGKKRNRKQEATNKGVEGSGEFSQHGTSLSRDIFFFSLGSQDGPPS